MARRRRRSYKRPMIKVAHKNMLKGALLFGTIFAMGFTQGQELINNAVNSVKGIVGGQS
jgi:hypothetical protein